MSEKGIDHKKLHIGMSEFYNVNEVYYSADVTDECIKSIQKLIDKNKKATFEFGRNIKNIYKSETRTGYLSVHKGDFPILVLNEDVNSQVSYVFHEECLVRIIDEDGRVLYERT